MNLSPLALHAAAIPVTTADLPMESLAANPHLSQQQKVAEASRQFEAIMLRQILSEAQKPVIKTEFTDDSTASGIYQDFITNSLADSMSKAGTLGLAKVFEQQLSHPGAKTTASTASTGLPSSPPATPAVHRLIPGVHPFTGLSLPPTRHHE